jgi:hypothetical protein
MKTWRFRRFFMVKWQFFMLFSIENAVFLLAYFSLKNVGKSVLGLFLGGGFFVFFFSGSSNNRVFFFLELY